MKWVSKQRGKADKMGDKTDEMGGKTDEMGDKTDEMGGKTTITYCNTTKKNHSDRDIRSLRMSSGWTFDH